MPPNKEQRKRLEELIETVDEATDVPTHMLDGAERDLPRDYVAKRWLNGKSALHAHLWVRSRLGEAHTDELCLLYQRKRLVRDAVVHDDGIRVKANDVLERGPAREDHLAHEGTVLVGVGEEGEDDEFVTSGVFEQFPAIVRLRFLNDCPCLAVNGDALQGTGAFLGIFGGSDTAVEVVDVDGYGELGPSAGPVSFQQDELPNEMIQAGSEVLDSIAANQTESRRRRRLVGRWVGEHDVPGSVKGVLKDLSVGIRLEEDAKFLVQNAQVFVGPTELESGAVERRTHKG
jgi:hypothetical protein